jgi:hypothetical protein
MLPNLICSISLNRGVTRDTQEEFQETAIDWQGSVIDQFDSFINHVFRTCLFFADLVPLCSSSTRLDYVAPELCKRVALCASSSAVTESRAVTPSDTRSSTPAGNLTTKGGASKPPTSEAASESAQSGRNSTPNLGKGPAKKLSSYEIDRNKNIARNKELLAQLDLQLDMQPSSPPPPPKEKAERPRKVAKPVPESERRRGRSAGKPNTTYVQFHFSLCVPSIMGIYIQV